MLDREVMVPLKQREKRQVTFKPPNDGTKRQNVVAGINVRLKSVTIMPCNNAKLLIVRAT